MSARKERQRPPDQKKIRETQEQFEERKMNEPGTYDYDPSIGEELLSMARIPGHPVCSIRDKYELYSKQMEAWSGMMKNGLYRQDHWVTCYNKFIDRRRAWLDEWAIDSKIDKEVWRNVAWSQLGAKIQPPKEVKTEADVTTNIKCEDLNNIIEALEAKKGSSGF